MPPRRNNGCLLARVNFPLYTLQMLTSRHILVGGGGGSSKTGVANGFEIFELSHNGANFVAEEVTRHETGPSVVMNCASFNDGKKTWLVAGQESHCQLYNVVTRVVSTENGQIPRRDSSDGRDGLRRRRKSERETERSTIKEYNDVTEDNNCNIESKKLQLLVKPADSIQTDFGEPEPLQRIARISPNGKFMATGGTDGRVRIWRFPRLTEYREIDAHTREIDDMDFSQDGAFLATIAKDGRAFVWSVENGAKDKELSWSRADGGGKYMYKRLRYARSSQERSNDRLFTLSNSVVSKNPSYLQLWDAKIGNIVKSVGFDETLSAIAVSDDGKFVAVGTMFSGNVDIFVAFSLQRALHVQSAHGMFVTGLEFLPTSLDGPAITSNTETAVVSISVDNRICIHSIPFRHTLPFWLVMIFIVLSICGAFIFCSYLGI